MVLSFSRQIVARRKVGCSWCGWIVSKLGDNGLNPVAAGSLLVAAHIASEGFSPAAETWFLRGSWLIVGPALTAPVSIDVGALSVQPNQLDL